MLVQWTSKLCPFHIAKHISWVQVHFNVRIRNIIHLIAENDLNQLN